MEIFLNILLLILAVANGIIGVKNLLDYNPLGAINLLIMAFCLYAYSL